MDLMKTGSKSGKRDPKAPDALTAELKKGFEWTTRHTQLILVAIVLFVGIGGGYSIWKYFRDRNEKAVQAKYFDLESQVLKKKEAFEAAKAPIPPMPKGEKPPEKKETPATGDFAQDYGDLPQKLSAFIVENPKTKAGAMAALTLAGLQSEYNKHGEALETLKKVQPSGLLASLVKMQIATLTANEGKCAEAIPLFEQLVGDPASSFLKLEAKLKVALCSEAAGDLAKAETHLNQVIEEGKQQPVARSAQKYLRLLQMKKAGQAEVKTN